MYTYIFLLAVCDPVCQNGGNCTEPDTCVCAVGYTGDRCQTRMFLYLFFTKHFDIFMLNIILAVCDPVCENGGNCTEPDTCMCAVGYTGDGCLTGICFCIHEHLIYYTEYIF